MNPAKLSKAEAQKIANNYQIGNVKNTQYLKEGYVNYNHLLITGKGKYAVQIFGEEYDDWQKERKVIQSRVLNYLQKNKFPYEVPIPLISRNGEQIMKLNNKHLWAYNFIEGKTLARSTKKTLKEIAKFTATYHKYVSGLGNLNDNDFYGSMNWLTEEYQKLRQVKPKNNLDRMMLRHIDYFEDLLNQLKKIKYGKRIMVHSDINGNNVIFRNGKMVGAIDFESTLAAPKAKDLAMALERNTYLTKNWSKRKQDIFLEEYEKHAPLTDKDKSLIVPLILYENCHLLKWYYDGMAKRRDHAKRAMTNMVTETKRLVKEWR